VVFLLANDTVVIDKCGDAKRFCWEDFKNWANEGIMTIASHGLYHPDFTKLSTAEIRFEVETAKKLLVEKLGIDPIGFAYPFDATSKNAIELVKAAGYQFAVAGNNRSELAALPNDPDRFKLPRVYPYSNAKLYPNLNGFNRPFNEVIASLTRSGPSVVVSGPTATPLAISGEPSEQFLQFCKGLPTDTFLRLNSLLKATFTSDISPEATANLPGVTTSASCNAFANNHPEVIVLHYTVGDLSASMSAFRQFNGTSAHYLIDRDGKVVQMVPEGLGAMHASCTGSRPVCVETCPVCDDSKGNLTEPYLRSIGIEIVNRGHIPAGSTAPGGVYEDFLRSFSYPYWEDYTPAQIDSLKVLVHDIANRWKIPIDEDHVIGHYRVNQKVDPGPALNLFWSRSGKPAKPPIFEPDSAAQ
jgi:N-acetyl-anhydromuramyl-L-alanine amidase AmpD